jgi:hypothetical protein
MAALHDAARTFLARHALRKWVVLGTVLGVAAGLGAIVFITPCSGRRTCCSARSAVTTHRPPSAKVIPPRPARRTPGAFLSSSQAAH